MKRVNFVKQMKQHQVRWAAANGLHPAATENGGSRDHVLLHERRSQNLYDPDWWELISGKEHRWARSLTSSQCFAVNLFGPLVDDPELAKQVFESLFPHRIEAGISVEVALEFAPEETGKWLGEAGQTTQVDACFIVSRSGAQVGFALVEVKLAETGFGTCRGARVAGENGSGNPDPRRCEAFGQVHRSPQTVCWMVTRHGRRYWDWLNDTDWFDLSHVPDAEGCPFRDGVYQLMRNAVLARALMVEAGAEWAEVAVCVHAGNHIAHILKYPIAGLADALDAARLIAPRAGFESLAPAAIVAATEASNPSCSEWARWMQERYGLIALIAEEA
ncbi:PGN_0703 family putative restriction endonuclease [Sphingopyxis sp. P8]|uniref:PGN_0703 family putative restriction endonuclease n=1 Tax=Sphingopyxis sp. P8 TaxID=2763256 RepID=UPI001D0AA4BD|nr:hypothetical protein [Sphingopyxis sp. P8]